MTATENDVAPRKTRVYQPRKSASVTLSKGKARDDDSYVEPDEAVRAAQRQKRDIPVAHHLPLLAPYLDAARFATMYASASSATEDGITGTDILHMLVSSIGPSAVRRSFRTASSAHDMAANGLLQRLTRLPASLCPRRPTGHRRERGGCVWRPRLVALSRAIRRCRATRQSQCTLTSCF